MATFLPAGFRQLTWRGSTPPDLDPDGLARLEKEQFDAVRRNVPAMVTASLCNAFAAVTAFIGSPQSGSVALWGSSIAIWAGYALLRRRWRRRHARLRRLSDTNRRATVNALAIGVLWSLLPILFFSSAGPSEQLVIACLSVGMMFGGLYALASAPCAATAFSTPIILAISGVLSMQGDTQRLLLALMFIVYTLALLSSFFANAAQARGRVLAQIESEKQALTDALTGLPNRRSFNDAIEREFARMTRTGAGFVLLCVDLDNFKEINDRLGHPAGDELLVQAATRMRQALRSTDVVARLGGDEFAILATNVNVESDAREVARRLVRCYDRPFNLDGNDVFCCASVGAALAPRDGSDLRELVKNADIALYRAKNRGACWRLFEPDGGADAREMRQLELDLRRVIFTSQLSLVFQPILNVATNELVGCEALLRWRHPERGDISPSAFIPLAERIGLIHEIGMLVIDRACAQAATLPKDFRVAVNVSAIQLRRADFAARVKQSVASAGLETSRIELEITETALLADDATSNASIRALAEAGISIALDDFGEGYSSLSYLRKLPLSKVKIDRIFVAETSTRADSAAIVRGVARMVSDLGMTSVAEGVETMAQLEFLRAIGCDEAQGYLISRPLPIDELRAFLAEWRPEKLVATEKLVAPENLIAPTDERLIA